MRGLEKRRPRYRDMQKTQKTQTKAGIKFMLTGMSIIGAQHFAKSIKSEEWVEKASVAELREELRGVNTALKDCGMNVLASQLGIRVKLEAYKKLLEEALQGQSCSQSIEGDEICQE